MTTRAFEALCTIVEKPGYPLLAHYKDDLYVYDRNFLAEQVAPNTTFIWVVRECGTYLTRLHVHTKHEEWIRAAIETDVVKQIYEITVGATVDMVNVSTLTTKEALALLGQYEYKVTGDCVYHSGELMAVMAIEFAQDAAQARVADISVKHFLSANARDLSALQIIVQEEVVSRTHSFFTKIRSLVLEATLPVETRLSA